jgi:MoxR-like ATPase
MQERQVTVDGLTRSLGRPFLVLATQNPIEHEGTYPLPEAQLDRFLARFTIGYPDVDAEWEVVADRLARRQAEVSVRAVTTPADFVAMQEAMERVHVDPSIGRYAVELVTATRRAPQVELGASPRGSLAVVLMARSWAALERRDYVLPDDIKAVAVPALAHRLRVRAEAWIRGVSGEDVVRECLDGVPAPVLPEG